MAENCALLIYNKNIEVFFKKKMYNLKSLISGIRGSAKGG
jgi:hypothetical protein